MDTFESENDENWKRDLRSYLIAGQIGSPQEKVEAFNQIGYYYQCYAPVFLYKYYGDKPRKLEMVKANRMWYSAPCNFNDPFDCEISINEDEIFKSVLRAFPDARGIRKGSYKWKEFSGLIHQELKTLQIVFDKLKYSMGISCLSESNDSLLMWAHYANNHRGMCVEYELPEIVRQLNFSPIPIVYSRERVSFCSLDLDRPNEDAIKVFNESITSKSPSWCYEKVCK